MLNIIIYNIEDSLHFQQLINVVSYQFDIIGYSDIDEGKKALLPSDVSFIPINELHNYVYDLLLINGEAADAAKLQALLPVPIDNNKIKLHFDMLQLIKYRLDLNEYSNLNTRNNFEITSEDLYPILYDHIMNAGSATDYFFQDLWAAKKVHKQFPTVHYDVGSRLDGFIAFLLAFEQQVTMIDIRPLPYSIPGLSFICADATNMDTFVDNSIESLSALSSVEHFGLGRYGDPIDPEACFKTMASFQRVLAPAGHLYFGVPVGAKDICAFNAHRIFSPYTILENFPDLTLCEFAYVKDNGIISYSAEEMLKVSKDKISSDIGRMSYGLFEFIK